MIREQFDWLSESERRVLIIDELDAVARSRATREMHSDEKADVNELLVQLDRAGRSRRLVLATTNYLRAIDDAVLRSGRFGRFVAVEPPDHAAAAAVVSYYLERLRAFSEGRGIVMTVPDSAEILAFMATILPLPQPEAGWFCCADLEELVYGAHRHVVRVATRAPLSAAVPERLDLRIAVSDLEHSVSHCRRSVTPRAIQQFLDDVSRHSPDQTARLSKRFAS
jgi:SpoVK/Ycf46/Vps4 family AAA+-type ATPase